MPRKDKRQRGNKYQQQPDMVVDVHGLTRVEAIDMVTRLFEEITDHDDDVHVVRIITGKGTHSEFGQPVLREAIKLWLTERGYSFSYAKVNEGGEGVLEVKL